MTLIKYAKGHPGNIIQKLVSSEDPIGGQRKARVLEPEINICVRYA